MSVTADPLLRRFQSLLEGQYAIERELGRGGMATVYLARDLRHGRDVAIKLLQPEITTASTAERFLREIQITAKLQHPHILPLIDSGARDGLVYYVMPNVEGESLRERLTWQRQCAVEQTLQVARQVASALAYAHARGVIHRDIKPENILLSDGQAMLADFGIARAIRDSSQPSITAVGLPLGTPAYMSPEQATGHDIDHRSDIYSLGCVLFEMLAGRPPFVAPTVSKILQMHLTEPPPAVSTCRSASPADLDAILARSLAKDPADRFQTAQEFADALGLVAAVETLERATPTQPLRRITPQPPAAAAYGATPTGLKRLLVAGGAVGILVIAGVLLTNGEPASAPRPGQVVFPEEVAFLASVGVKPLDVIGGDTLARTASAGIGEEITAQLSKMPRLRVISRTTMEVVSDKRWTSRQVGDSLGLDYLLEGSVQRSGRDLGVTLQLIDVRRDAHVWSDSYRQPLRDILMTRQDIARRVVEALAGRVRGLGVVSTDAGSRVPAAVQARAHGLDLSKPIREDRLDEAIRAFERALTLDTTYAAAAADLSDALRFYVDLGFRRLREPYQALAEALRWGDVAVRLDPNLAKAYAARGSARIEAGVRPDLGLADIERAVTLAPSDGGIRVHRGIALARLGKYQEAVAELEAATALDPLNAPTRGGGLALTALGGRRYALAAEQAGLAAAREPSFEGWRAIEGLALMLGGDPERCVAMDLAGIGRAVTALCERRRGNVERAEAIVDSLTGVADEGGAELYTIGFLGAYRADMGDATGALAWLDRAYRLSPTAFDFRFLDSGLFDRVRADPGFARGLEAILSRARAKLG